MGQQHHHHQHPHHLDEAYWAEWADNTELEGEVLLNFVTDTAAWVRELRGPDAPPVRRVLDVGSGPGVGTCELARLFPEAQVVAVDSSPEMLERTSRRATAHGLDGRVATHLAELPDGVEDLGPADLIWSSMALHHVGDEVAALRILRGLLAPGGLVAIAERDEPLRALPDSELTDRIARAGAEWFDGMRAGLPGTVPSQDLPSMMGAAGYEIVGTRIARIRLDPPLPDAARRMVAGSLRRSRDQFHEHLDDADLRTLDQLTDPDDPHSVLQRPDVFVAASRRIVIARPAT